MRSGVLDPPKAGRAITAKRSGPAAKNPRAPDFDPDILVTALYLADFMNVDYPQLASLGRSGELPRDKHGMYPLRASCRAYLEWHRDQARRNTKGALANKLQEAKTKHVELDLLVKQGQLIDVQEAIDRYVDLVSSLKALVMSVPSQVSRDPILRKRIEDGLNAAFEQAVQSFVEVAPDSAAPEEDS